MKRGGREGWMRERGLRQERDGMEGENDTMHASETPTHARCTLYDGDAYPESERERGRDTKPWSSVRIPLYCITRRS